MIEIGIDDREFNATLDELSSTSRRTAAEVVTFQAIMLIRALVKWTRLTTGVTSDGRTVKFKMRGRARAGWWPSWKALGVYGIPRGTTGNALSLDEGSFLDGRRAHSETFVAMTNEVSYIDTLQDEDNILGNAFADRREDMIDVAEERYSREMARRSG